MVHILLGWVEWSLWQATVLGCFSDRPHNRQFA